MDKVSALTIQAHLRDESISKPVKNPTVELLAFLSIHDRIQIWTTDIRGHVLTLRWNNPKLEAILNDRGNRGYFFATPRTVLCEAFYKPHYNEWELRRKLAIMARADWNSYAGDEFDEFVEKGTWRNPESGERTGRHHHVMPVLFRPPTA